MASDLTWALADPTRLDVLVRDVRELADGYATSVVYLDGDVETAIRRAARQRGPEWIARMVRIAEEHGAGPGRDIDRIVAYERGCHHSNQRDLLTLAAGGWQVLRVDAQRPADDVLAQSREALGI
jgi:thymidylate kinase